MATPVTIALNNLSIGYRSHNAPIVVAENLKEQLEPGEVTCLLGHNGAGKSTLLRTLARFLPPLAGEIYVDTSPLAGFADQDLAHTVGVVLTDKISAFNLTVEQLVGAGRSPYSGFWGTLDDNDKAIVSEAMEMTGITSMAHRRVVTLSDGERQKAMIAKVLAQQTPVILLDEPSAFLDYPSKVELMGLLRRLARTRSLTVLLSTHDLDIALMTADRLWLMSREHGFAAGSPAELASAGEIGRRFDSGSLRFNRASMRFDIRI